jgi:HK97 family phage major capsid protein
MAVETKELETQLTVLQTDLKGYFAKAEEQKTQFGSVTGELKTKIDAVQKQLDAIDVKMAAAQASQPGDVDTFEKEFKENESLQRVMKDKRGLASIHLTGKSAQQMYEQKTTITSGAGGTVSTATSGILQIGRLPDITMEARQALTVRNLLSARPTTFQVVDFVKVNQPPAIASPVVEGAVKAENAVTFTTVSERVRTIATWIPATRQVLDDFTELLGFLKSMLPYYVNLEEEIQLLSGDGTGENLHGLIPQATGFNTALLSASRGWNKIDVIGRAIQQVTAAKELQPTFVVMHPNDWWDIRLTKDSFGRYILGDPQQGGIQASNGFALQMFQDIFGLAVEATTSIASGTFLVGSGSPIAAEIRDRMDIQVDISTEHSDFFTRNLVAIRGEKRLALITRRPGSFISGNFNQSPA